MYLGIEIGGTKLQLGVGTGTAPQLVELQRFDVVKEHGARGILEQIKNSANDLRARHKIERIGIGFGGPVNKGVVTKSHQIEGWENFPLVHWCNEELHLPTILGNDCDSAALAEATIGAGRGANTVFYVTVGTGVGGGLVLGGRLHGMGRPAVAEIGHLRWGLPALSSANTVESVASGPGIVASAKKILLPHDLENKEVRALGPTDNWNAKQLAEAAAAGNSIAHCAIATAIETLAWAIAQVITLIAPEIIVVGGGVSLMGEEQFFQPLRRVVDVYVFPPLLGSYKIVPAALGEEAVVHGAIALAASAVK